MEAIKQFRDAISVASIEPPKDIIADGKIHRFPTNGRRDDDAGWYVFHHNGNGLAAGAFGCWRSNINRTWCSASESTMTAEERAEYQEFCRNARRERETEQQRIWNEAAEEAKQIWAAARDAPDDFPYLQQKRVKSHGLKCDGECLLVPVRRQESWAAISTVH